MIGDRDQAQTRFAELIGALCEALDMPFSGTTPIVEEVGALVTLRKNMRTFLGKEMTDEQLLDQVTQLLTFAGEYRGMSDTLTILRKTLGLGVDCAKDTIVAKVAQMHNDMAGVRSALGVGNTATANYIVEVIEKSTVQWRTAVTALTTIAHTVGMHLDMVHDLDRLVSETPAKVAALIQERAQTREDLGLAPGQSVDALCTRLCKALGLSEDTSVAKTVNTLSEAFEAMHRVRDAIGLNENASVDYTVQKIADVRRAMLWAQGTVKMVREALDIDGDCDRQTILSTIAGLTKASQRAKTLHNELTETRDGLADRVSELDAIKDALSLSPATPATEVVDQIKNLIKTGHKNEDRAVVTERRALIRFLDMAESTTWHEITNEVMRRISYKDGVLAGIGDSIKTLATIVGLDPTVASLPCPGPIPSVINTVIAIRDSLLGVVGHPGGESLSLNAALSMLQGKVSGVALSLGLSEYASLVAIKTAAENLRKDRDNQARTIGPLTTNQDAQISAQYLIRTRLITLLCEDPNRAKTMTMGEVVDLAESKIAALALNLSLPETATWNGIMSKIQGMAPSMLCLQDLVEMLGTSKDLTLNEALIMATNRIRGMRKGLLDLLNARP